MTLEQRVQELEYMMTILIQIANLRELPSEPREVLRLYARTILATAKPPTPE